MTKYTIMYRTFDKNPINKIATIAEYRRDPIHRYWIAMVRVTAKEISPIGGEDKEETIKNFDAQFSLVIQGDAAYKLFEPRAVAITDPKEMDGKISTTPLEVRLGTTNLLVLEMIDAEFASSLYDSGTPILYQEAARKNGEVK